MSTEAGPSDLPSHPHILGVKARASWKNPLILVDTICGISGIISVGESSEAERGRPLSGRKKKDRPCRGGKKDPMSGRMVDRASNRRFFCSRMSQGVD